MGGQFPQVRRYVSSSGVMGGREPWDSGLALPQCPSRTL